MKKILLVDDEILVRVGIKSIINWEENGYTIIGEASNGSEAMDKVRHNVPDIVITDLVMDTMNGLELIKLLKKEYPQIKIIVLSCYNDFENVKEAMKFGASDYVFKLTLKPLELITTLNELTEQIADKSSHAAMQKKESLVHRNINAIKSRIIRTAIDKSYISAKSLQEEMDEINIKVNMKNEYILMYINIDNFKMYTKNSFIKEKELLKFSMQNIADEVLQKYEHSEVFDYEGGTLIGIINMDENLAYGEFEEALFVSFEMLKEFMKRYLGIDISAAISNSHRGVSEINDAYNESINALKMRFLHGSGGFYSYNKLVKFEDKDTKELDIPNTLQMNKFAERVDHLEEFEVIKFINEYIDWLKEKKVYKAEKIRRLLLELLYSFSKVANSRGIDIDSLKDEYGLSPYQVISQYESVEEIRRWFGSFVTQFVKECTQKLDSRCREEIIKIKNYIRGNLDKDISISMAANYVNMSDSYFSHFFKKETGTSFVDYVNTIRIERSKELILQTDYKIYEIAEMVGFENANYFSLMFKKVTGKSPNFYRKNVE